MQAVGADGRAALKAAGHPGLTGKWPAVPHAHPRDLVFGPETGRFRTLVDRRLELTPKLTWSAVKAGSALLPPPAEGREPSTLARQVLAVDEHVLNEALRLLLPIVSHRSRRVPARALSGPRRRHPAGLPAVQPRE
jgi:hypothetical protein